MSNNVKKILVVDDNEIFVHSIERHLRRQGLEPVVAYDGLMAQGLALDAAKGGAPFDLAITDVTMPKLDGFALVSWLNRVFPQMAILIVSGFGNLDLISKVLRPHLDFLHRKPVLPKEIMASIDKINLRRQGCSVLALTGG